MIGEFAHLSGVSAKTLRNYDERGVFHPAWVDPQTGYRWYSPAQLPMLRRIVALRNLGMGLAEVARLASGGGDLRAALRRRRAELEQAQRDLARTLAELDIRVDLDGAGPDVVVRTVAAQRVAVLTGSAGDDLGTLFYELEAAVLAAGARANLPPGAVVGPDEVEVHVPVTAPVADGRVATRTLPAVRVAAVIHRGPYETMRQAGDDLARWVDAAGYTPAGPIRIVYLQFGAEPDLGLRPTFLTDHAADYVTELQLPIA